MVRDEHLVAEQLDLVLVDCHPFLDLGEVEYSREGERIVYVEVDVEHGVLLHRVESVVEVHVVLVLELGRSLGPDGLDAVDHVVLVCFHALAVFPLGLLAEYYRHGHELAVLLQKAFDAALRCEFVGIAVEVEGDGSAAVFAHALIHLELRRTVAAPEHRLGAFLPAQTFDGHLRTDHESGVESEAEVADDAACLLLVLLEELAGR